MKKLFKLNILLIIVYLFISAIYVLFHIDFGTPPEITGPGFSESTNLIRNIMGLPKIYDTYEGVPSIYLLQVIIKLGIGIICSKYLYKEMKIVK